MSDKLIAEIKKVDHFSEEDIELFRNALERIAIPKGEYFLKAGEVSKYIGYIESGLVIYYKLSDGDEIPCDFAIENEWITYLKSFVSGTESDMYSGRLRIRTCGPCLATVSVSCFRCSLNL